MNVTPASMPSQASFTRTRSDFFLAAIHQPAEMPEEETVFDLSDGKRSSSYSRSVQLRAVKRHDAGKHGYAEHLPSHCPYCNPCPCGIRGAHTFCL